MLIGVLLQPAWAGLPGDLDALVALAVALDPQVRALAFDADAATARALAARRPMAPVLMVGASALGAPPDAPDPTMGMVGVTQMVRGYGEARADADRIALDATRATADQLRLAADLRLRLWQVAVRVRALEDEIRLLDDDVRSAQAARDAAFARYGAGAVVSNPMGTGGMGGMPMDGAAMGGDAVPGLVQPKGAGAASMGGMTMGGGSTGRTVAPAAPMAMSGGSARSTAPSAGSGLPTLLALQAEISRVEADRAALAAELDGEVAVVALLAGPEAADAVRSTPAAFFGGASDVPETRLAQLDVDAASAAVASARAARRPDVMISLAERFMPSGMTAGTDLGVGVELPLWGARSAGVDAARADVGAALARRDGVTRDLAVLAARARGSVEAARARARALDESAVPEAQAAWDAALALFAAGTVGEDEVLRAWQTRIAIGREAVRARRDVGLREAEFARVEVP